jgi:hypothetical protein
MMATSPARKGFQFQREHHQVQSSQCFDEFQAIRPCKNRTAGVTLRKPIVRYFHGLVPRFRFIMHLVYYIPVGRVRTPDLPVSKHFHVHPFLFEMALSFGKKKRMLQE